MKKKEMINKMENEDKEINPFCKPGKPMPDDVFKSLKVAVRKTASKKNAWLKEV